MKKHKQVLLPVYDINWFFRTKYYQKIDQCAHDKVREFLRLNLWVKLYFIREYLVETNAGINSEEAY
jgi:hypothetical protein